MSAGNIFFNETTEARNSTESDGPDSVVDDIIGSSSFKTLTSANQWWKVVIPNSYHISHLHFFSESKCFLNNSCY